MPAQKKGLYFGKRGKKPKAQPPVVKESDPMIEDDEPVAEPVAPVVEVQLATPFTGAVVSPTLKGLVIIPRTAGSEVSVLKGFLRYYSMTEPFVGSITTRTSFMHKKGGVLL